VHFEIDRIRATPLFAQLSRDELETVASRLEIREGGRAGASRPKKYARRIGP
jgi:hypothetical protein